jgi:hypothetical protein
MFNNYHTYCMCYGSIIDSEEFDYGIVQKIQSALGDMHGDASWEEFRLCREVLKGHDGNCDLHHWYIYYYNFTYVKLLRQQLYYIV